MALGSTLPLVKMSTTNIPGGKGGRCVRLTTSPPSRAVCHEIWESKTPGTLWATPGLLRDSFTFYLRLLESESTPVRPEGIGTRTRDPPVCSTVPNQLPHRILLSSV
jgi:hypothetical protein